MLFDRLQFYAPFNKSEISRALHMGSLITFIFYNDIDKYIVHKPFHHLIFRIMYF